MNYTHLQWQTFRKIQKKFNVSVEFLKSNYKNIQKFLKYARQLRPTLKRRAIRIQPNNRIVIQYNYLRRVLFDARQCRQIKRRKKNVKAWSRDIVQYYKRNGGIREYTEEHTIVNMPPAEVAKRVKEQIEMLKIRTPSNTLLFDKKQEGEIDEANTDLNKYNRKLHFGDINGKNFADISMTTPTNISAVVKESSKPKVPPGKRLLYTEPDTYADQIIVVPPKTNLLDFGITLSKENFPTASTPKLQSRRTESINKSLLETCIPTLPTSVPNLPTSDILAQDEDAIEKSTELSDKTNMNSSTEAQTSKSADKSANTDSKKGNANELVEADVFDQSINKSNHKTDSIISETSLELDNSVSLKSVTTNTNNLIEKEISSSTIVNNVTPSSSLKNSVLTYFDGNSTETNVSKTNIGFIDGLITKSKISTSTTDSQSNSEVDHNTGELSSNDHDELTDQLTNQSINQYDSDNQLEDFLGFEESNGAFTSNKLDFYMNIYPELFPKDVMNSSENCISKRLIRQSEIEGLLTPTTLPPLLLMPEIPASLQKLRTVSERRSYLQKLPKFNKLAIINNEAMVYRELQRKMLHENEKTATISMSQTINSCMPFTRQGWKAASFISTDLNNFYYQKVMVDNKCIKLFGVYGNNAESYKPKYYSKVPKEKQSKNCATGCLDALNWLDIIPITSSSNKLKLNTCTNKTVFKPCPLSKKPDNIVDDEDINAMLKSSNKFSLLKLPELVLEVKPEVGRPLNNLVKTYMQPIMPNTEISLEWAKFSVSTLKQHGRKYDETPNNREFYSFPIPYANGRETVLVRQAVDRSEKLDEYFTTENSKAQLSFRANLNNNDNDDIMTDCADFIEGLINCVAISVCEDSLIQNDPDLVYENKAKQDIYTKKKSKSKCEIKSQNKKQRSLVMELKRLNATIVDAHVKSEESCTMDYCKGGCVCDSLNEGTLNRDHCKKVNCMFGCTCKGLNSTRITRVETENHNISTKDAYLIRQKATARLAPIEKDFNSTIVLTNDSALLINDSEINRKRRSLKAPKRFEDFTGDEQSSSCSSAFKKNCATSNACKSPVIDDEKSKELANSRDGFSAIVAPIRKTIFVDENQFNSLKHCVVPLNRFPIDNMVPFCYIHELYKCFCGGKATEGERFCIEREQSKPNNETIAEIPDTEVTNKNIVNEPEQNNKISINKSTNSPRSNVIFKYYNHDQDKTCRRAVPIPSDIYKSKIKDRNLDCFREENKIERNRLNLTEHVLRSVYHSKSKNIRDTSKNKSQTDVTYQTDDALIDFNEISAGNTSRDGSSRSANTSCNEKTSLEGISDFSNDSCETFVANADKNNTCDSKYSESGCICGECYMCKEKVYKNKGKPNAIGKNTKNKNILHPEIESDSSGSMTSTVMEFDETSSLSTDSLSNSQLGDLNENSQNLIGAIDLTDDFNDAENNFSSNPCYSITENDSKSPINADEYEDTVEIHEEQQLEENDFSPMKLKNFYEFVIKDMNTLVSKKMQDIDKVLKREKKIIPAPSCNIICVIKWKQFVEAFDENYVYVWKASLRRRTILVATIDRNKPSILNARKTEELSSLECDDDLLLRQLLLSRPNNDKTNNMAIILQGREGYWLVRGFLIMDKRSACPKPTPKTHPILTKKINILCSVLVRQRNNEYKLQKQQKEASRSENIHDIDKGEDNERGEVIHGDYVEKSEESAYIPTDNANDHDVSTNELQLPKISSVTSLQESQSQSGNLTLPERNSSSLVREQLEFQRKRLSADELQEPPKKKIRFSSLSRNNGSRRVFMPTRAALMTPMAITEETTLSIQHEKYLKQLCEQAELKIIKTNIELRTVSVSEVTEIVHPTGIPGDQKWLIIDLRPDFSHIFVPKFNVLLARDRIIKILTYSEQKCKSIKFQYFKNFSFDLYVTAFAKQKLYFGPFRLNDEIPVLLLLQTVDQNIMLREVYQQKYNHKNPKIQQSTSILLVKNKNCFEVDVEEEQSEEIVIDSDSDDDVIIVENSKSTENDGSSMAADSIECEQPLPVVTNTNYTIRADNNNQLNICQISGDTISGIERSSEPILPKLVPINFNRGPIIQIPVANQIGYDIINFPDSAVITNVATAPPEVSYGSTIYITSAPKQTLCTVNTNISSINGINETIQKEQNPAVQSTELPNTSNTSPFKMPKLPKLITVTNKEVISAVNTLSTATTSPAIVKPIKRRRDSVRPYVSAPKQRRLSTENVESTSPEAITKPLVFDINLIAAQDEPPASILIKQNFKKNENVNVETALPIGSYINMERITPIKLAAVNNESLATPNTEVSKQTKSVASKPEQHATDTNTGERTVLKPNSDFTSTSEESFLEKQPKSNVKNESKILRVFKRTADGELKSGTMRKVMPISNSPNGPKQQKSSIFVYKPTPSSLQKGPTNVSNVSKVQQATGSNKCNLGAGSVASLTANTRKIQRSQSKTDQEMPGYVTSDVQELPIFKAKRNKNGYLVEIKNKGACHIRDEAAISTFINMHLNNRCNNKYMHLLPATWRFVAVKRALQKQENNNLEIKQSNQQADQSDSDRCLSVSNKTAPNAPT